MTLRRTQVKPRKHPSQARSRATVDAILDAAARVLVKRRYDGLTTNAVAEVAGISVGSLYQYFPNKESLVAALHDRHALEIRAIFKTLVDDPTPRSLEQTLRLLVGAAVAAHRHAPVLHEVLETEVPHLDRFEDQAGESKRAMIGRLFDVHRGEITVPDRAVAVAVAGELMHALVHAAVINPPPGVDSGVLEAEAVLAITAYLTAKRAPSRSRKSREGRDTRVTP